MPSLSTETRIILGIIAATAGVVASVVGNVLALNILYFFTKRGRKPTKRPVLVWAIFYTTVFVSVVVGSIAAFSSTLQENVAIASENQSNISTQTVQGTEQVTSLPSKTPPIPTHIPATPTQDLTIFYFNESELRKPFVYMAFDKPPEIKESNLFFDYLANEEYGQRSIFLDLESRQFFFISTAIAVDEASPNSYAFLQVHTKVINDQVQYANFGVNNKGEIFLSTVFDKDTIGDNFLTWQGRPLGEYNDIFIGYTPVGIVFYANDKNIYTIESIGTGSFYASIVVSGDNFGSIKSRWNTISWSFEQ